MSSSSRRKPPLDSPTSRQGSRWHVQWDERIAALTARMRELGDRMPSSKDPGIGPFVLMVRRDYWNRPQSRTTARARELEAIPGWSWYSLADQKWLDFADKAQDWYAASGFDVDPEARLRLGHWIRHQRICQREGRLAEWQQERLSSMPGWTWTAKRRGVPRRSFVERELGWFLSQMMGEKARHGGVTGLSGRRWDCDIVFDQARVVVEFDGRHWHAPLAQEARDRKKTRDLEANGWLVVRVREEPLRLLTPWDVPYGERESTAGLADRVGDRLVELGVVVQRRTHSTEHLPSHDLTHHDNWYDKYERLLAHVQQGGSAAPVTSTTVGEFKLGQWVAWQRRALKLGRLSAYKRDLLSATPGWEWELVRPTPFGWEAAFEATRAYLEEHGRVPVFDVVDPSGFKLGHWAAKQRQSAAAGTLTPERYALLDALEGWEWVRDRSRPPSGVALDEEMWQAKYDAYVRFVEERGHHPRGNHVEERPLANWAATQRIKRRRGDPLAERETLLEAISGWSWGRSNARSRAA